MTTKKSGGILFNVADKKHKKYAKKQRKKVLKNCRKKLTRIKQNGILKKQPRKELGSKKMIFEN